MPSTSSVLLFDTRLLVQGKTFILAQAAHLERFSPSFLGLRRVAGGLEIPPDASFVVNQGGVSGAAREAAFLATGWSPEATAWVRTRDVALLHAHFGPGGAAVEPFARRTGLPLITTIHGYETMDDRAMGRRPIGLLYLARRRRLQHTAARFLAVSRHIAQAIVRHGYPEDRIEVHYIGLDVDRFSRTWPPQPDGPILFVGRLAETKGCEYLIRAMAAVTATHSDARLVIIGDGPLRVELESLAQRILPTASFLGWQEPEVVRNWMNRAQVVCVPSVSTESHETEGLPTVLMEAMAMEIPVIAYASAGIPEVVRDGENGLLYPERDVAGLASGLHRLLDDRELERRLGSAGRDTIVRDFNIVEQTRKLESIYESVLDGARNTTGA